MKPLKIACSAFQLSFFLDEIEKFLEERHLPLDIITEVDAFGYAHEIEGLETMKSVEERLLKTETLLFFPFSLANSAQGVACANGEIYLDTESIPIGTQDFLGYLLKVKQENLEIYSSVFRGGSYMPPIPSMAEVIPHAGALEEPMTQWIHQFIHENE